MSSSGKRRRNALIAVSLIFVSVLAFGIWSLGTTFKYWPWTLTTTYASGEAFGFKIGETKAETLAHLIALQESQTLSVLRIFESGRIYSEQYRGDPAQSDDLARVSSYDHWHVGVVGCNCWLLLDFSQGKLSRVVHKVYRGPTE